MQITLVQVEIEEAIRQYVNTQINVREGMRIDIDLKATRGAEGYQAFIDIVEITAPASIKRGLVDGPMQSEQSIETSLNEAAAASQMLAEAAQPKADAAPGATEQVNVRRTRGPNKPKADPTIGTTQAPVAGADPFQSDEGDGSVDEVNPDKISSSAGIDAAAEEEVAEEQVEAEIPAEKPRSLFGGLTRPNNG